MQYQLSICTQLCVGEFQGWNSLKKMNSKFYTDFDHVSIAAGYLWRGERKRTDANFNFGLSHADKVSQKNRRHKPWSTLGSF